MNQAIVTHDLSKSFGQVHALQSLSISIPTGQTVALLGPNGAGKSTLIDLILGLSSPTSGTVHTTGRIGAVLQSSSLLPDASVQDTVRMIASTYGTDPAPAIAAANLEPIRRRKIRACSGGEQQRVKLALALVAQPELLILDEPTAGMDPVSRRQFWQTLTSPTVLFATHYLQEASIAERILILHRGRLLADDTPAGILASTGTNNLESAFAQLTSQE